MTSNAKKKTNKQTWDGKDGEEETQSGLEQGKCYFSRGEGLPDKATFE